MTKDELIAFEREVATAFEEGKIRAPIHLSGGNEDQLIDVFKRVQKPDWVFSTWRNHYHALLFGISPVEVLGAIMEGRSMNMNFPEHRFFTSAIVGGILPMALGVAAGLKRLNAKPGDSQVWCFVGDMAARSGIFMEARQYAQGHELPIRFVVENNGKSTNTDTEEAWGDVEQDYYHNVDYYGYTRVYPHVGTGKRVSFV